MSSSIFVRADGEADIVAQGPGNSLLYFSAPSAGQWSSSQVAGPGTTNPEPAIFVRPDGEVDIVAQGQDNSLWYYWGNGSQWGSYQIAGAGTTFSPPSIVVRASGEADVVAQGPGNSLLYYWAVPGGKWSEDQIAGAGTTFSQPSIVVRARGEADVVAQGPGNSLLYYWAVPGGKWTSEQVAGAGTTNSAPAIFVRADGETDIVAQGSGGTLMYYWVPGGLIPDRQPALAGTRTVAEPALAPIPVPAPEPQPGPGPGPEPEPAVKWSSFEIAGPVTTFSPPSIFVRADGEADIVAAGPEHSLWYYWASPGDAWQSAQIADGGLLYSSPAIFVRPNGEADIVALASSGVPVHYSASPGGAWASKVVAGTYQLAIPQLHINTMRTGHLSVKVGSDTDYAYLGVQIKGQPAQTATVSLGDHSDGDTVQVGLQASVLAADADLVTFQYSVINSSNGASAAIAFLEQAGSQILAAVVKADETAIQSLTHVPLSELSSQEAAALVGAQLGNIVLPGFGTVIGAVAGWFSASLAGWAEPDCDGPVAIGLRYYSGAQLAALAGAGNGAGTSGVDDNPGVGSGSGCGSNSDYQVYWSVS